MDNQRNRIRDSFKKGNRGRSITYLILTFIVIAVLVGQIITRNYENCFTCILTLVLFLLPTFIERKLHITLSQTLELLIVLFIFCAEILGEIRSFYLKISWWDTMLHTLNGFLMAAIGFSMVDILNRNAMFKFELSPFFVALVGFCFSMTIGVLWEFFEYFMDIFAKTDMQKDTIINALSSVDLNPDGRNIPVIIRGIEQVTLSSEGLIVSNEALNEFNLNLGGYLDIGLIDTMNDLIVNFIGAVVFSIIGFFYIKNRGKGNFAKKFIPQIKN